MGVQLLAYFTILYRDLELYLIDYFLNVMMKILIIILTLILISCEKEIKINDLRVNSLEGNNYEKNLLYNR